MSDINPREPDEAMLDLLVKQVTEGLSPAEQRALDVMDSELASAYLRDLERAAAAAALAGSKAEAALPAALSARIAQQAAEHFASAGNVADLSAARAAAVENTRVQTPKPRANRFSGYGWLAAAACLVLAIFGWQRSPTPLPPVAELTPAPVTEPTPEPPPPPTLAQERDALLAKADSLKIPLGATKDPAAAGVTGDVVWDPGYATRLSALRGLGGQRSGPASISDLDIRRRPRQALSGGWRRVRCAGECERSRHSDSRIAHGAQARGLRGDAREAGWCRGIRPRARRCIGGNELGVTRAGRSM